MIGQAEFTLEQVPDHAPLLERAFARPAPEGSYAIEEVHGEVPAWLRGTYYLNGPASFRRAGFHYRHWLDGDGMVCALRLGRGAPRFTGRYVRSTKRTEEEAEGKPLYRAFGTSFSDDRLVRGLALASPVNVSVVPFAGKLLAFGEQGLPWELDPETLETRGEHTFGGALNAVSPLSAHAKVDSESGELVNFGVSFSATRPLLNLYRFAPEGSLLLRKRLPLPYPCSMHDFALASRHAAFHVSPYVLDMEALMGGATLMDALAWKPELGCRLLVVERESGALAADVELPTSYCLHLVNAFEEGSRLVVDGIDLGRPVYDQYHDLPELFGDARGSRPVRYTVDLERQELVMTRSLDFHRMADFPAIDPRQAGREYRHFWMLAISKSEEPGRKFFDQLVAFDWSQGTPAGVYQAPPGVYLGGEPAFAGDPADPDHGAVICQAFDAEREAMDFLVFDAFDVARGPIARLPLREPVHLGFHACFEPA